MSEAIMFFVADKFSLHKTLGELILIDRVTNMTSACGVVEVVDEKVESNERASFVNGELPARGDIFEEFLYDASSLNVLKYQPVHSTYGIGEEIPLSGESYSYPESFDILVLRDSVTVKVRNGKIDDIISFVEIIINIKIVSTSSPVIAFYFSPPLRLIFHKSLEKLTCFTGTSENKSFPVLFHYRLWHKRLLIEIVKI